MNFGEILTRPMKKKKKITLTYVAGMTGVEGCNMNSKDMSIFNS